MAAWLLLVTAGAAGAAPPDLSLLLREAGGRYVHRQWTVDDGLPVNALTDVARTADGYLWIGSYDGLLRFDGAAFTRFDTSTAPSLGSNRITHLIADPAGPLWIFSESGHLVRYAERRFQAFEPVSGDRPRGRDAALATDGTLWLATERGLYRTTAGQGGVDRLRRGPEALAEEAIASVGSGREGRLWLATEDGRVAVIEASGRLRSTTLALRSFDDNPSRSIHTLAEDATGDLWIGTSDGAFRAQGGTVERLRDPCRAAHGLMFWLEDGRSHGCFRAPDGTAWQLDDGRLRRDGETVFTLDDHPRERFQRLAFDADGTVWAPSSSRGLFAFRPTSIQVLGEAEGLPYRNVYPLHQDRAGSVWIGDLLGHLTRLSGGTVTVMPSPFAVDSVLSIYHDPESGLLLQGGLRSLSFVAGERRLPVFEREAPGVPTTVETRAMLRSRRGRLLLGTHYGLWASRPGDPRNDDPRNDDPRNGWWFRPIAGTEEWKVRALLEDPDGGVWLATADAGIAHLTLAARTSDPPTSDPESGRLIHLTAADGLSSNAVRDLHRDERGMLWIATEDRGLNRLDPTTLGRPGGPRIERIERQDGLWDNSLHRILEDDDGRLWLSTNRGIFHVHRRQLEEFLAGEVNRIDSVVYTERDGLRHREANGGVQGAGLRDRDGRLWFPSQNGVAIFDPRSATGPTRPPPVHVERLLAGDRELPLAGGELTLEPHQRRFEIAYTAVASRAPERTAFRYRLLGFDRRWVEAGDRRRAFYDRVPPGRYTFHVQARSSDGVWNRQGARLLLRVRPFFWETWWFRGAMSVLAVAAVAAGVRWREHRQRLRQRVLEAEVARMTLDLERERRKAIERAEKLAELDRSKSELFADVSHEFRTPLTLVLGPLRDLLANGHGRLSPEVRRELELASHNAERLVGLVEQILDTARLDAGRLLLRVRRGDLEELLGDLAAAFRPLAERRGLTFRFAPSSPIVVWADPEQLEKIFANLLSNAMRYTPRDGTVEMWVEAVTDESVAVAVRDDGPGIAAADRERIFERFGRADAAGGEEGVGLGLPLARRLAELHGGDVTVDSPPGEGSTFRVRLRRGRGHFTDDQIREHEPWRLPPRLPAIRPAAALAARHGNGSGNGHALADRTTVLVVDDHPDVRAYVRRHLEPCYRVEEAADGAEALDLARDLLPDLVISDVMMPEMDGYALCRELKSDSELDWVPVILLTAKASAEDRLEGLGQGADDYIPKPFDVRELVARADNLIASRRRLRERFAAAATPPPRLPLAPGVRPTPDDRAWMARVRAAIEASLVEDTLTVETLAARLAVHRGQLHKRLKQLTGTAPLELIQSLRLERAAALLETEAASVSEAAYAVGFKSVAHFSRRFNERYGQPPTLWRSDRLAASRQTSAGA